MTGVVLRDAVRADVGAVARFQTAAWREAYTGLVQQAYLDRVDAAVRAARWEQRIRTGSRRVTLAEQDGEVVGVASRCDTDVPDAPPRELASLYVVARHHGDGTAARLLEHALEHRPAHLWVFSANPRAIAFYRKHGFAPDGSRAIDPGTGLAEERLVRS